MMRPTGGFQEHGGVQQSHATAFGFRSPDQLLDFSVSINPLGAPPGVAEALAALDVSRYPDPGCTELRDELSRQLDVPAHCLLVGNGSTELIHLVTRVFVRQGQRPIVFAPTFSEFERAVAAVGGNVYPWTATAARGFRWALKNKPAVLDRVRAPLVWLCNPNNPTGVYLSRAQVESIASGLTGGPLVLDEAYIAFVDDPWQSLDLVVDGRVIVLRSMTKDFALAGLRLGYLVAHPDIVTACAALQPAWSVNSAAQTAGLAALRSDGYLAQARAAIREAKQYLCAALGARGFELQEGVANFILVRVGDAPVVRHQLLAEGIAVRDCSSFGLPEFIRIGIRCLPDCLRLVQACSHLTVPAPNGSR